MDSSSVIIAVQNCKGVENIFINSKASYLHAPPLNAPPLYAPPEYPPDSAPLFVLVEPTVSDAAVLVADPAPFDTITLNPTPLSLVAIAGVVYALAVAPLMLPYDPLELFCH